MSELFQPWKGQELGQPGVPGTVFLGHKSSPGVLSQGGSNLSVPTHCVILDKFLNLSGANLFCEMGLAEPSSPSLTVAVCVTQMPAAVMLFFEI